MYADSKNKPSWYPFRKTAYFIEILITCLQWKRQKFGVLIIFQNNCKTSKRINLKTFIIDFLSVWQQKTELKNSKIILCSTCPATLFFKSSWGNILPDFAKFVGGVYCFCFIYLFVFPGVVALSIARTKKVYWRRNVST